MKTKTNNILLCYNISLTCINSIEPLFLCIQLPRIALMEHFDWLMDLERVLVQWRSVSIECGEPCVVVTGVALRPELCADNWGTVSTQVEVSWYLEKRMFLGVRCFLHNILTTV